LGEKEIGGFLSETVKGRRSEKEVEKPKSLKKKKGLGLFIFKEEFWKKIHQWEWGRTCDDLDGKKVSRL